MLYALLIDNVIFIDLRTGVNYCDQAQTLLVQVVYHVSRIGKLRSVPGKAAISIHIVNVEPDSVAGVIVFAQAGGNSEYLFCRRITPAGLVVAYGPTRGHWHMPGKFCVLSQHIC